MGHEDFIFLSKTQYWPILQDIDLCQEPLLGVDKIFNTKECILIESKIICGDGSRSGFDFLKFFFRDLLLFEPRRQTFSKISLKHRE